MSKEITIFPNVNRTKEPYYLTIDKAYRRIKDGKSKELVEKIRSTTDKKERTQLKKQLPSYCFSGKFSERRDDALIEHSGYVALDFDHLDDYDEFWKKITQDEYTCMAFRSPSGDGVKAVIKIPANKNTHVQSCVAIEKHFSHEKLDKFHDVSRICFESYDPNIYYNKDSKVFTEIIEEREVIREEPILDPDEIYSRIIKWLSSKGEEYYDGNKHKYLLKLAGACARFGIPQVTAVTYLYHDFSHKTAEVVDKTDIEKIIQSSYKKFAGQLGTATFTKKGVAIFTSTKKALSVADVDVDLYSKDIILLDSVRDSMFETHKTGLQRGETTYYEEIDKHYRMKRGEITLVHGIMNHGKSTFLMQLLLIKAVKDNYKFAFFSPEQNPPDSFYDDLVHMFIGKNTQPYYDNCMTDEEYKYGMDFVGEHFFYIYPEDDIPTPQHILNDFDLAIKKHGVDGCVIDPYNQLDNDISRKGGREDLYLSEFLSTMKRFALKKDIFFFIVSHPKGSLRKNADGDYEPPNYYDLSGGAMWGNKCDNIIYVHRPRFTSDKENTELVFGSQKIKKQKLCGVPGDVEMDYDRNMMRFYIGNKNPLEARKDYDDEKLPF